MDGLKEGYFSSQPCKPYGYFCYCYNRFTDDQTIGAITSKANSLPHIRGGTRTDRALELAAEEFFGWEHSGDRPDKPNVLLVLTDGDTNEGSKPFNQVIPPLNVSKIFESHKLAGLV